MSGIDEKTLAEWERLANEATPGPWRVDYQTANDPGDERLGVFSAAYSDEEPGICFGSKAWPLTRADADLIAAARAALPSLVAEVRRLREAVERAADDIHNKTVRARMDDRVSGGFHDTLIALADDLRAATGER